MCFGEQNITNVLPNDVSFCLLLRSVFPRNYTMGLYKKETDTYTISLDIFEVFGVIKQLKILYT